MSKPTRKEKSDAEAQASLNTAKRFGRACLGCGVIRKDWSVPRQRRCDKCTAGGTK